MSVAELQPMDGPAPVAPRGAPGPAGSVVDLRGIGTVLRRRWATIAAPAVALGVVALAALLIMPPRYGATTRILFDPRNLQVFQNDLQARSAYGEETGVEAESQLAVITSAEVLAKVVDGLDLARDPDFGAPRTTGPVASIRALFGVPASSADEANAVALRRLQAALTVRRVEKTYILEIAVETPDAAKSARIANAVAASFLRETIQSRTDATRRSGVALTSRLDSLRTRLAQSEGAVEAFRGTHDLVGPNGKPVLEQQLTEIANQLTLARTRRAEQEARIDVIRRAAQGNTLDAMSEAALSPVITALKEQLAAADRQAVDAELTFGPRHPTRIAAGAQVSAARERLRGEMGRLVRSAQSDLDRARIAEDALAKRFDALKTANAEANTDLVRLRELERVAASDRSIYEAFLNRAKDLGERETLDTVDARVLTPAVPPVARSGPPRILLVFGAVLLGGIVGVGAALAREQFDDTVRSARQVTAETFIPVLASVRDAADPNDPGLWRLKDEVSSGLPARGARLVLLAIVGDAPLGAAIARHLARASEADGLRAILVDGDDARCDLTRSLKIEMDTAARPSRFRRPATARDALRIAGGVNFIPARSAWAAPSGSPRALRKALDALAWDARLILVYGGSTAEASRVRALASAADDVVLIAPAGRARIRDLHAAVLMLGAEDAKLRGVVVTGSDGT